MITCKEVLQVALTVGREKEGELATTSLEFEYLLRKSQYEMLIGGDDIRNGAVTLGTCFSMFVYICTRLLHADRPKTESSVDGEPQGNWR